MSGGEPFLFLTGATGHTGSRVARRFLGEGWGLRCLVNTADRTKYLPASERLEVVEGDIEKGEEWRGKVAGAAAFVHMAHAGFLPQAIAVCHAAGVRRLISLSSTRRFTQFPEETARRVIEGETALEASGLDYTILRSAMIFGGDRDNNLEKIVRWLRRRRAMPLLAGGRNLVQPIFVQDLVDAIARALAHPETTRRRALIVAGPEAMTTRGMIEAIGRAMGRPPIWVPVPYWTIYAVAWMMERLPRPLATRAQVRRQLEDKVFDIREASEALGGWRPRPFEEAIRIKLEGNA